MPQTKVAGYVTGVMLIQSGSRRRGRGMTATPLVSHVNDVIWGSIWRQGDDEWRR